MGNDVSFVLLSDICGNFNPRSRVGNDVSKIDYESGMIISIHVPAWGTTGYASASYITKDKFQSTFPRGERPNGPRNFQDSYNFNPRSRVGNDHGTQASRHGRLISIHVPAWGTTDADSTYDFCATFQSTFPRGERLKNEDHIFRRNIFQSTFPRGERRLMQQEQLRPSMISIHVPAWGTTSQEPCMSCMKGISIHVPAWGTTTGHPRTSPSIHHFNPRSRVGNDLYNYRGMLQVVISIHVPAWGTTKYERKQADKKTNFNPRSRVGNDGVIFDGKLGSEKISIHVPAWGTTLSFCRFPVSRGFQSTFPRGERRPTTSLI